MEKLRLTTFILALKNLKKRSFRTKSLIALGAVLAFSIFCSVLLTQSLSLGSSYMSGRMGADIMVVPRGCSLKFQNTLLKSESNTFYMKENLEGKISKVPGVEMLSPQLFIGSLNASCCTVPVQLIGFNPKTDFTIKAWMTKIDSSKLEFGEVVIGSRVNAEVGSDIWLFGQPFKVAATLDDTGMGFNSSVFMTIETAKHMIESSREGAVHPTAIGKDQVSALFIKLAAGSVGEEVAENILALYPQTDVVILKEMMQSIKSEINNIKGLVYVIQVLLWTGSILILIIIYTFTINERKREFGLLLSLGSTRTKLAGLLMTETLIINVTGALLGAAAASFFMYEFRMLIAISFGIPYMQPTIASAIRLGFISLIISVLTGVLSCGYSIRRVRYLEPQLMIREYE